MSEGDGYSGSAPSSDSDMRRLSTRKTVATLGLLWAFALAVRFAPLDVHHVVTAPPMVLALTFVPGALVVLLLFERVTVNARTLLYTVGCSLVSLLALGFVINLTLPRLGILRPLAPVPLAVSVTLFVAGLGVLVTHKKQTETIVVPEISLFSPVPLTLALLPAASILTVTYLNWTGETGPVMVLLGVLAVVPLISLLMAREEWHPYVVWFLALAVLYHKSFWKNFGFSGSPGVIRAWEAQRWSPGVAEMSPYSTELLQNGVLFPTYAWLSGVDIVTELEVVNPFLVAFIPLAVFVLAREYFGSRHALLAASLFVFAHPFYMQYPTAGRAATPVLFLALFAVVLSDSDLSPILGSVLGVAFASGLIVSHYGTTYFVMMAILGALVFLQALYYIDERFGERVRAIATDGGPSIASPDSARTVFGRNSVLSPTLALFYSVGAMGWYLYATQGQKFKVLPNHVVSSIQTLMGEELIAGRTGARVVRDYGSTSIRLSKVLYLAAGLLMGIGFLYVYYQRFVKQEREFVDDRYLALATMMLGLFGTTFVARNWGGGRPMMITFTFTAAFAAVGATALLRGVGLRAGLAPAISRHEWESTLSAGMAAFAVLLVVLFSLNSGLASAMVLGGQSPSNVPWQPAQDQDRGIDNEAHIWLNDYGYGNVYGDRIAHGQTDWRLPAIELGSARQRSYGSGIDKPRGDLISLANNTTVEPGYVLLLSHNVKNQAIVRPSTRGEVPLSTLESELERRNRVYDANLTTVYYAADDEGET